MPGFLTDIYIFIMKGEAPLVRFETGIFNLLATLGFLVTTPWLVYKLVSTLNNRRRQSWIVGKTVLITGASSGIGEGLAHAFYKSGCRVVLASRRKDELERVKNDLLALQTTVPTESPIVLPVDLSDVDNIPQYVSSLLSSAGHVDILVNNGGISNRGSITDTTIDVDMRIMKINYFGSVAMTKAILPSMIARKSGHIVFVSSVQGLIAIPNRSAYGASKHAVQAFCDSLRAEVADSGIKVTIVSPGYVQTNLSINALTASGDSHGVMDASTAAGYSTEYVSKKIVDAVLDEKEEVILAQFSGRFGIWLRFFAPSLYFRIMARRARQSNL